MSEQNTALQPIVLDMDDALYSQLCEMASEADRTPGDFLGDIIEEAARAKRAKPLGNQALRL